MKFSRLNGIMLLIPIIALVSLNLNAVEGKNILFFWGSTGYSHRISAWPLVEKLAENGHSITFFSPYPSKVPIQIPNVTDFVPENLSRDAGLTKIDFITMRLTQGGSAVDDLWYEFYNAGMRGCESILKNPKVIKWIEESSFDLVIINALFNDCGYGLAYKFKAPHMMYSPTSIFPYWGDAYGLPEENYPEFQYHYGQDMTFGKSVWNALRPLHWQMKRHWELFPYLEGLFKKHLKIEDMPSFIDIERNTSLIFANTHFSEEFPRSLPPMVVPIGGMHCKDTVKPLAQEVANFIQAGEEGFIYMSFGTYASLANLPDWLQETFLGAMAKMDNIQFIVKHDGKFKKAVPKNVKLVEWISQQDVLGHPKIRAFICHGGLLGTQESIYHGVPMIILPLFAEQDYNAMRANSREIGIFLEIAELTQEQLITAVSAILTNEKYRNNIKRMSLLFKDRPQKPVDTAVWWVEYALKHKDLSHLQPVGIHRNWYQKRMLDIWGLLAVISLSFFVTFYFLVKLFVKCMCNKDKEIIQKKKGKKDH